MLIISVSSMAEAGRVLHLLKNNIGDTQNTILIVLCQAPYLLGRRLPDLEPVVRIFGEEYQRNAKVVTIGGLSAHTRQDLLTQYALSLRGQAKQVILFLGKTDASIAFQ